MECQVVGNETAYRATGMAGGVEVALYHSDCMAIRYGTQVRASKSIVYLLMLANLKCQQSRKLGIGLTIYERKPDEGQQVEQGGGC